MWAQLNICDQLWALVDSVSSNLFLTLFLFLSVLGPGAKPSYKNKKKTVHGPSPWQGVHGPGPWKWSMDPVQRRGPWTPGPCFVLTRSSPKLERGRLCLYFVLSSFLHMFQLAGRLPGKKKIIALPCFFFFGQIRISSNTVFLHLHGPLGEIFPSSFAPAFLPLCFFAKLWHFAFVAV